MKSLNQYNAERMNEYLAYGKPCKNGIACPVCGEELWDANPLVTLTSLPPRKQVICKKCEYKGYRVA